jgi:hypothetical protein
MISNSKIWREKLKLKSSHQEEENSDAIYLALEEEVEEAKKLDATLVERQDKCLGNILKINQQIIELKMLQRLGKKQLMWWKRKKLLR